jgi:hypothetical protein
MPMFTTLCFPKGGRNAESGFYVVYSQLCCEKRKMVNVFSTGSGQLSERELRTALVNGDWSPFDPHTVRMMIRMFDADRNGTISFDEFWYVSISTLYAIQ